MAAPEGNKNAEQWSEEEAIELFNQAISLATKDSEYDFIGELARDLDTYRDIFTYLKDKFDSCKPLYSKLLGNLEANCFSHSKNGKIKEASAIMNLKSNYRWTDRAEVEQKTTLKDERVDPSKLSDEELRVLAEIQRKSRAGAEEP